MTTNPNPNEQRPCWFVGAFYGGAGDQTERFLEKGTWENGFTDKLLDKVRKMQPGDRIAIKSSYRQAHNLPFDYKGGKSIGAMRIKAIGVITENLGDGRHVKVNWTRMTPPREWFFFSLRTTVHEIWPTSGWMSDALIRFTFENEEQDYNRFLAETPTEIDETPPVSSPPSRPTPLETLASDLLYPLDFLQNVQSLLHEKKQVIFQGPPGTGKTYAAQKLAKLLADSSDNVSLVQFHPSYSYEDFVQGYRPTTKNNQPAFELRDGPLLAIARKASNNPAQNYYLIIDEINRGNLAKVLGELYFLLEYRTEKVRLMYSDELFSLPDNLCIIGTMNTADRSIALVDLALRRRFSFVQFHPDEPPVQGLLKRWLQANKPALGGNIEWLPDVVDATNRNLANPQAAIGPSYFMKPNLTEERINRIWKHDILPYIEESLFNDPDSLPKFTLDNLRDSQPPADSDPLPTDSDPFPADDNPTATDPPANHHEPHDDP